MIYLIKYAYYDDMNVLYANETIDLSTIMKHLGCGNYLSIWNNGEEICEISLEEDKLLRRPTLAKASLELQEIIEEAQCLISEKKETEIKKKEEEIKKRELKQLAKLQEKYKNELNG